MMEGSVKEGIIYTIGYSAHEIENFVALLKQYRINAVADVRSVPYSRRQPHFNRRTFDRSTKGAWHCLRVSRPGAWGAERRSELL